MHPGLYLNCPSLVRRLVVERTYPCETVAEDLHALEQQGQIKSIFSAREHYCHVYALSYTENKHVQAGKTKRRKIYQRLELNENVDYRFGTVQYPLHVAHVYGAAQRFILLYSVPLAFPVQQRLL